MNEKRCHKPYWLVGVIFALYLLSMNSRARSSLFTDSLGEEADSDEIVVLFKGKNIGEKYKMLEM